MPPVIFLNGASSAGKTSLGKALQDTLEEPYLLLGLDTCFSMVPARWAGGPRGPFRHQGFAYVELPDEDGRPMLGISHGEVGRRMLTGFQLGVAEIVRAGNPVIIDEMLLSPELGRHWLTVLEPFGPLLVGVHCAVLELERRERDRTSRLGLARWSAGRVHTGMTYDLDVETTSTGPAECAREITTWIREKSGTR